MCGILGSISRLDASRLSYDGLSAGICAIKCRGPDGQGTESFVSHGHAVSLTHSRLSVIELSDLGRQPMHDAVSGWWVTYNGEIYNYLEIREELSRLGWSFRSGSDTEVLLKAWAQWGTGALSRFNGMFAFAAFHPEQGELWLVRDRFGVKPLAWTHCSDGSVVFSSSVAGMAYIAGDEIDIDYCGRGLRYKVFETAQSGSPFKNVKTVPAGGWVRLQLSEGQINTVTGKWYDLEQAVAARAQSVVQESDDRLLEICRDLLEDSVKLRLRSDVPVAVSLSGGLDSSVIASLASNSVKELRGFTYGLPDANASEGPDVMEFSRRAGIDVTYVWPQFDEQELSDAFEETMAFQEAPFPGLSIIAQNQVYRRARQANFKVLLGGQGGDEIFAGYRKFFIVALREAFNKRDPGNALSLIYSLGLMMVHEASQARMYWENLDRYRSKNDAGFRLLDWHPGSENLWGGADMTLSDRQIGDIQDWSLPTLLRYEDRNSMGYGIESRLPYMDYRLLELALALPSRLKIRSGYGKWALRRIVADRVPDTIRLNRKKRGFDVTQTWIRDGFGATLRSRIFDNRKALSSYLRTGIDLDHLLSDRTLSRDGNLLDEAMMLAWLVKPVRPPVAGIQRGIPA